MPATQYIATRFQVTSLFGIVLKTLHTFADAAGLIDWHAEVPVDEGNKNAKGLRLIQAVLVGQVFNGAEMKGHYLVLLGRVAADILTVHAHAGSSGEALQNRVDFLFCGRPARPTGKQPAENSHESYNQRRTRFL